MVSALVAFSVAAPSWAVGTGGTRFGRFPIGGEPRTTEEKIDDVAALDSLTASNDSISLHVPWDDPDDPDGLREYAEERSIAFDAMNSNTFQDNPSTTDDGKLTYKFGSLANADPAVREVAVEHNQYVIDLGARARVDRPDRLAGRRDQSSRPSRPHHQFERVAAGLSAIHDHLPDGWQMYTEHKPYEPAFYATVNYDWGSSLLLSQAAGPKASCLVDLGHHLPNANIEQIVSRLAMAGRLGGFHFNDSKYGDDDLTTGSIKPFQLFLIFCELIRAGEGRLPALAYMIDQSHNIKDPLEDLIQSTEAVSIAYAQALLVERDRLRRGTIGQRRRHGAGTPPGCLPRRRPAAGGRGPASLGRSHRSTRGLPSPRLPQGDDRGARPGLGRHRAVTGSARVLAVDLGATSVRVAAIDLSTPAAGGRGASSLGALARQRRVDGSLALGLGSHRR